MELTYVVPTFLSFFIGVVIFIQVKLKFGANRDLLEDFIKAEEKVNLVRKKDFDETLFLKPNIDLLPIQNFPENDTSVLKTKQEMVIRKSKLEMINFDKSMTNFEIKKIYGINNLQKVALYEEHFDMYIVALNDWSKELINKEKFIEAEKVLQECISFGSEYTCSFFMLCDLYFETKKKIKLSNLSKFVSEKIFISNYLAKNKITQYINENLSKM